MANYYLYTDASYLPKHQRGGWAWVLVEPIENRQRYMTKDSGVVKSGADLDHGIWSLEIRAVLEAIKYVTRRSQVTVFCDNHTVCSVINGTAHSATLSRYSSLPVLIELEQTLLEKDLMLLAQYVKRNSDVYAAYADHCAGGIARETRIAQFSEFEHVWGRS